MVNRKKFLEEYRGDFLRFTPVIGREPSAYFQIFLRVHHSTPRAPFSATIMMAAEPVISAWMTDQGFELKGVVEDGTYGRIEIWVQR